jgi:hypothetical protein
MTKNYQKLKKLLKSSNFQNNTQHRRVARRGDWGTNPPLRQKNFFILLGFLRKTSKIPPLNFFHTKILVVPPRKNSDYAADPTNPKTCQKLT